MEDPFRPGLYRRLLPQCDQPGRRPDGNRENRGAEKIGHYRASLAHTDDMEMWLRFAMQGAIAETESVQAYIRIHPQSRSSNIEGILQWNREVEQAFLSFFEHEGRDLPDAEQLLAKVKDCLSKRAYWSAVSNVLRREGVQRHFSRPL